jgi:hypothetical protein
VIYRLNINTFLQFPSSGGEARLEYLSLRRDAEPAKRKSVKTSRDSKAREPFSGALPVASLLDSHYACLRKLS